VNPKHKVQPVMSKYHLVMDQTSLVEFYVLN